MKIKETVQIEREIHVAACLNCGGTNIRLRNCNYSSFNHGGGSCLDCKHEVYSAVGIFPSRDDLAKIWNAKNDVPTMISAEEAKIAEAKKTIRDLKAKAKTQKKTRANPK